jgi:hypothetical protein
MNVQTAKINPNGYINSYEEKVEDCKSCRHTLVIVSAFEFQLLKSPTNAADCNRMQESVHKSECNRSVTSISYFISRVN